MRLDRLWLRDFRSYEEAEAAFAPGLTAVVGSNGQGKTNLLEAIAWLATLRSFRQAPPEALVRAGAASAVLRAEGSREGRSLLLEAELPAAGGRTRVLLNRQKLGRSRDLLGALRAVVFTPDDLALVKGGPGERRDYLDDALVALAPRHDAMRLDLERVLRQRNALLRSAGGRLDADAAFTLDVWDAKLAEVGEALARSRAKLVGRLEPAVAKAYGELAGAGADVRLTYVAPWREAGLAAALAAARTEEVRRGTSLVGPQRDDLDIELGGLPARTHASQGEQRSLALALRLAAHATITDVVGSPPLLLLDDVFSELDAARGAALVASLPVAQTVLTTAGPLPEGAAPEAVLRIAGGAIT